MDLPVPAQHLLDHIPAGLMFLDPQGRVRWHNEHLAELIGHPPHFLEGREAHTVDEAGLKLLLGGAEMVYLPATDMRRERWLACRWETVAGGRLGHCTESTPQHTLEAEVAQLRRQLEDCRTTDLRTGLLNRRALLQALDPQLARCRRYNTALSLVVLHLDGCDQVPQSDTEAATALVTVARLLRDQLRWADFIARLEPEPQFVVALPETAAEGAVQLAHKLRASLKALPLSPGEAACIHPNSIGITPWQRGDDAKRLLQRAQAVMMQAREQGDERVLLG